MQPLAFMTRTIHLVTYLEVKLLKTNQLSSVLIQCLTLQNLFAMLECSVLNHQKVLLMQTKF